MNINITVVCETCDQPTNCRIGMSNRDEQPFHFCCQTCGSPINITLRKDRGGDFVGAHQLIPDLYPFDDKTNFVDLHLDFPVSFEKYVMGLTPYMRAVQRTHDDGMRIHRGRLNFLNEELPQFRVFALILKLYIAGKLTPFKMSLKRNFNMAVESDKPEDINAALYKLITDVMMPFAYALAISARVLTASSSNWASSINSSQIVCQEKDRGIIAIRVPLQIFAF